MSADPSQLFYADPTNPQSFNLYGYVANSPLTHVDPSGMDACAVDLGHGMARITNAADGGGVDCPGNGSYITTDQQVTGVGFNSNGDLSVYGANGSLYNPDGTAYNPTQSITVNGDTGNSSYADTTSFSSPNFQVLMMAPGMGIAPNNGQSYSFLKQWWKDVSSCISNYALPTIANDLNPIPSPSASGVLGSLQSAADQGSQSFMLAAGAYSVSKGLTVPLRSSIVRAGLTGAETLGKVSGVLTMGTVVYALGDAVVAEYKGCL